MRSKKPNKGEDMILIKIHRTKFRDVVALCDSDLIGKKFEEKDLQLDITERFYKGEEIEEEKLISILHGADIINIVGKESIELAIKAGVISRQNIIKIAGIPHAQYTTIE